MEYEEYLGEKLVTLGVFTDKLWGFLVDNFPEKKIELLAIYKESNDRLNRLKEMYSWS